MSATQSPMPFRSPWRCHGLTYISPLRGFRKTLSICCSDAPTAHNIFQPTATPWELSSRTHSLLRPNAVAVVVPIPWRCHGLTYISPLRGFRKTLSIRYSDAPTAHTIFEPTATPWELSSCTHSLLRPNAVAVVVPIPWRCHGLTHISPLRGFRKTLSICCC